MASANSSRYKFFKSIGLISPNYNATHTAPSTQNSEFFEPTAKPTFRRKLREIRDSTSNHTHNNENGKTVDQENAHTHTQKDEEEGVFELNFTPFTPRDDFRLHYLRKLSYFNVWVPSSQRPPSHQTVCIFDWDDTLLCTSFINCHTDDRIELPRIKGHLDSIQKYGKLLLELAMTLGKLFIITNAKEGWVQYSSKKYLPVLYPVIQKITVISARKHFEDICPGNFHEWKRRAFLSVKDNLNSEIITNLISVGDSEIEMEAVQFMGKEFPLALIKTIKFRDEPYPDELAKQLELLYKKFEKLCLHPKSLKIGLERK